MARVRDLPCAGRPIYLEFELRRVDCRRCGAVKRETLEWLYEHGRYTKRYALWVGRRCQSAPIREIAAQERLDWHAVKEMDKTYMSEQLALAAPPDPRVIGIDEISAKGGREYRIVVSDLEARRAIWYGGSGRKEEDLKAFYAWMGPERCKRLRLSVMDMWRPFENATRECAPGAAILYDKFHVMRHLGEALDAVRKSEYARLGGAQRKFIKGQKYNLLSRSENLKLEGREALAKLLNANRRLNVAYLLKESFSELWNYRREEWARKFFANWVAGLKWQRLPWYEKFARLVERHWDGIAAHCGERHVALGFVEGLNNKIRVIQRRAYGLRDEDYLRLKILSHNLPQLPMPH